MQRHRRQGQDHHDAGRARPYRRAGPRQGLQVGRRAVPEHRGARRPSPRIGTSRRRRGCGRPISPSIRRSTPPSSTTTTWRWPRYNVMKARNRTNILIGGVDAMPPAIQAVSEGRMFATVRNSVLPHPWRRDRRRRRGRARAEERHRHPEADRHRRAGRDEGQRARHAVDGGSLPDLASKFKEFVRGSEQRVKLCWTADPVARAFTRGAA